MEGEILVGKRGWEGGRENWMAVKDGGRHSRTMIIHKMEGLSIKKSISKRLKYKVEHKTQVHIHT